MAADFGGGLGTLIGGTLGANALGNGQNAINNMTGAAASDVSGIAGGFGSSVAPYNSFGQSFLPGAADAIGGVSSAASNTQGWNQFMSGYTNTPAAQYQLQQADATVNNSAAAKGGVLSGANLRNLSTINNGIVSQNANSAYEEYLKGNNQQFGQLESALGNMFQAIGVGQTATGQQAGVTNAEIGATSNIAGANIGATSNIAQAQAKNDQSKGSGLGSIFGGLGAMKFPF